MSKSATQLYKAGHLGGCVKGGDRDTYYPNLWKWIIQKYNVIRVLDVGCGEAHSTRWFHNNGCEAYGVDGLRECLPTDCNTFVRDLTKEPFIMGDIDLVWCCELVEHIEERFLRNLLMTLSNGRVIAMTHALPGQRGYHHVNCRNKEYWVQNIERMGYRFLKDDTEESKRYGHKFWTWSGLIFKRV